MENKENLNDNKMFTDSIMENARLIMEANANGYKAGYTQALKDVEIEKEKDREAELASFEPKT